MQISIIGAGVSGLSAGCYLQMQGFDTEIFEKNPTAGGLCTSWNRGEYTFDGCIHWLMGSNDSNPYFQLWSELIDMSSIRFVTHESRVDIEVLNSRDLHGSRIFHLYTNMDRLKEYLLDLAPEDGEQIQILINAMRRIQSFEIPPMIKSVPDLLPFWKKMAYIRHLPLLFFMMKWKNITNFSFAQKLKNPFLREAFELLFDGDDLPLLIMILPLACNDKNGAGYPIGGSKRFVQKLEDKYLSLGGKISFNREIKNIITENGEAKGILFEDGASVLSDITLSAADWNFTFFKALEGKFLTEKMTELKQEKVFRVFHSAFLVSLGIEGTFPDQSHFFRYPLPSELHSPDGKVYSRMEVHVVNYDTELAPVGKTVVSVKFYTEKGEYWINLRKDDFEAYQEQKKIFADQIIRCLEEKLPGIKGKIEEIDIATPATFHRYTHNWKGSTQAWLPSENLMARPAIGFRVKGLKNFYYTSHWVQPGGGLPVAIKSARDLAQVICRDQEKEFVIQPW